MISTGDYAVVSGRAYLVETGPGSGGARLRRVVEDEARWADLVPVGPPLVGPVVDLSEYVFVEWDRLSWLGHITVWWRGPGGHPLTGWEWDESRVWCETLRGQPYGPDAVRTRGPEYLGSAGHSTRLGGWVDADLLYDRCLVEVELDIGVFQVPTASWPKDKAGRPIKPSSVTARHVRFDDTTKERPAQ